MPSKYPWYEIVSGDDIEQGDVLTGCYIPVWPHDMTPDQVETTVEDGEEYVTVPTEIETVDLVVMSQTCDMVKSRPKIRTVLLCPIHPVSHYRNRDLKPLDVGELEKIRRGSVPSFHMVKECTLDPCNMEISLIDFSSIHSLPLGYVRTIAKSLDSRLRLLSPYKENLSQAFARFFMRVGLPDDNLIPEFKKK